MRLKSNFSLLQQALFAGTQMVDSRGVDFEDGGAQFF